MTASGKRVDSTACVSSSSITDCSIKPELAATPLQQQQQQQQRLLDAECRVKAAAQTVAATAAAATAALCNVLAQQILFDTHTVLAATTDAVSSADRASVALKAQVAALQELHSAQLETQQQCMSSNVEHAVAADCASTMHSDQSDSDDDCAPLAYASAMYSTAGVHSDTAVVRAPATTVTAAADSNTSSNSSSAACAATQKRSLQQQPCVQCGKLTKKRCRRCQAMYYCSEQCQMLCFRDPEHRTQCDTAAAVLARQVA